MTRALLIALAALLMTPALSSAATPLPVGESDGREGRAPRRDDPRDVHEAAAQAARREARRASTAPSCRIRTTWASSVTGSGGSRYRVPKRRRTIDTGDAPGAPTTAGSGARRTRAGKRRVGRRLIASVPLTQRGAVYLDEQEMALGLVVLLGVAGAVGGSGENTYPTYAQLVAGSSARPTGSASGSWRSRSRRTHRRSHDRLLQRRRPARRPRDAVRVRPAAVHRGGGRPDAPHQRRRVLNGDLD